MTGGSLLLTVAMLVAGSAVPEGVAFKRLDFQIPVKIQNPQQREQIKCLIVWFSTDEGRNWYPAGQPFPPTQEMFSYTAPKEGVYYFSISATDKEGRQTPNDPSRLEAKQRVLVDCTPPKVRLTTVERRGHELFVRWDVKEDHPHPSPECFKLVYSANGKDWYDVNNVDPKSGQCSFHPDGEVTLVKLQVMDIANNLGEDEKKVPGSVTGNYPPAGEERGYQAVQPTLPPQGQVAQPQTTIQTGGTWNIPNPPLTTPTRAERGTPDQIAASSHYQQNQPSSSEGPEGTMRPVRGNVPIAKYLNTTRVSLKYKVEKYGPSGLGPVDVFLSRDDGRTWVQYTGDKNVATGQVDPRNVGPIVQSLTFDLPGEGMYGIYLVLRSGAGIPDKPNPREGDAPHVRIRVDTTPPQAVLMEPRADEQKRDTVIFTWQASDSFLPTTPILLEWAEQEASEWHLIGPGELPNTGKFDWRVPPGTPHRVFLRLTVRDTAGNVSVAQTAMPILIDLKPPVIDQISVDSVPQQR